MLLTFDSVIAVSRTVVLSKHPEGVVRHHTALPARVRALSLGVPSIACAISSCARLWLGGLCVGLACSLHVAVAIAALGTGQALQCVTASLHAVGDNTGRVATAQIAAKKAISTHTVAVL